MRRIGLVLVVLAMAFPLPLGMFSVSLGRVDAQDTTRPTSGGDIPIFGLLQGESGETGSFSGTVTDLIAGGDEDTVSLDGLINGLALIGDDAVRIVAQSFSSSVEPIVTEAVPVEEYDSPAKAESESDGGIATPVAVRDASRLLVRTLSVQQNPTQPEPDPDACDILYLNIEPITLNLLGLELVTSSITIDLNAIPGDGNLLGNLLCALAGLLDDSVGETATSTPPDSTATALPETETPETVTPGAETVTPDDTGTTIVASPTPVPADTETSVSETEIPTGETETPVDATETSSTETPVPVPETPTRLPDDDDEDDDDDRERVREIREKVRRLLNQIFATAGIGSPDIQLSASERPSTDETAVADPATSIGVEETLSPDLPIEPAATPID